MVYMHNGLIYLYIGLKCENLLELPFKVPKFCFLLQE